MYDRANWPHFDVLPHASFSHVPYQMARYRTCTSLSSDRPAVRVWHVHTAPIHSDVGLRRAETDSFGCWKLGKTSETAAKCMQNSREKLKKSESLAFFYAFFQIFRWCFLMLPFDHQLNWFLLWNFWRFETSFTTNNHTEVHFLEDQMVVAEETVQEARGSSFAHNLLPNKPADSKHRCTQHFPPHAAKYPN